MVFILKIERRKYRFHKRKDADPNIAAGPSHRGPFVDRHYSVLAILHAWMLNNFQFICICADVEATPYLKGLGVTVEIQLAVN